MRNERPVGIDAIARAGRPGRPEQRRARWLKACAMALGMTLAAGTLQWSAAQRGGAPRIKVAPSIVAKAGSQAALPIEVGPREAVPDKSFLRLRGFPHSVSLSDGHAIAPGSWAVPLFALGSLKAVVPAGVSGRADITITLVAVNGTTLAEARTALVVKQARVLAAPVVPTPRPPRKRLAPARRQPAARPPNLPGLSAEETARAERFLALGGRHLEQGNISAARMFFLRAAEAGLAAGALKMAATYDPAELARLETLAVTPDRDKARKWYEKARELGAPEADERLVRLDRY